MESITETTEKHFSASSFFQDNCIFVGELWRSQSPVRALMRELIQGHRKDHVTTPCSQVCKCHPHVLDTEYVLGLLK